MSKDDSTRTLLFVIALRSSLFHGRPDCPCAPQGNCKGLPLTLDEKASALHKLTHQFGLPERMAREVMNTPPGELKWAEENGPTQGG